MALKTERPGEAATSSEPLFSISQGRKMSMNAAIFITTGRPMAIDPSLNAINALIAAHQAAYAIDEAAWLAVSKIEDSEAIRGIKFPSVHVGRKLLGRDGHRNDVWEPIYVYSVEDIDYHIDIHLCSALAMCGNREDWKELERRKYEAKRAEHKANLAIQKAEQKRVEDGSGYTDALEAARATNAEVKKIERAIVAFVPQSLAAAVRLASFACENLDGNSYFEEKDLLAVLASIGRARSCD
ncbi:hypothetical protein SAMN05428967_2218 [Phyllobacterium sp. YR620]|uniref:hypothetical protein n=1 Tax=Phyllobacterium sp. YR620 TaxID=1881066 RepID=UPI00088C4A6B|nr:hypothetical protein [Phyllobacterium sp. YR620]SDP45988.1 hypothetical protein SAMN05428967_2218 [Phyllobacterium sp. YR620]